MKHKDYLLCIVLLLLAASCSQDTDDILPSHAPDGTVPFTFTAMAPPAMTTRAVQGMDWWKKGDKITVKLVESATGMPSTGTYTITDPKTGAVEVLPGDQPALWQGRSNTSHKVYAWYPAIAPDTAKVDIFDQSTPGNFRNADLLHAYAENIPYGKPHKLVFARQMAKVRVEVMGIDVSTTNIEVKVLGYAFFSLNADGKIDENSSLISTLITACHDESSENVVAFEALLPPKSSHLLENQEFIRIKTGGKAYYFTPLAADRVPFKAGYTYTYRVTLPRDH